MIPIPMNREESRLCRDAAKFYGSKIFVEEGTVVLDRPCWLTLESALDAYLSEMSGDHQRMKLCLKLANDIATAVRNDFERRHRETVSQPVVEKTPAGCLF